MKKITSLLLALMSIIFSTAFGAEITGADAQRMVPGAEKIKTGTSSSIPEYIKFRTGAEPAYNHFETWMKLHFRLPANNGFKLLNTDTDGLDYSHARFQQTINGIPVEGTMYIVHVKNNQVVSMNGLMFDNMSVAAHASQDKEAALSKALQFTNAILYRWQVPAWEAQIKKTSHDESATWYPQGELVYAPLNGNYKASEYRLCYRFDVYAQQPLSRKYVFVDATSGEVILTINRIHDGNSVGTAITAYSGSQTITTDSINATTFRLRETGRGQGIETYNLQQSTNYTNTDFTDSDNNWNNVNAQLDQYAGDAHWGAEMTYDFYFYNFGRNSIDNAGFALLSYVHYNVNFVNAFWDGTEMTYGDGDNTYTPLTSLDVTAHEITHGLTNFTSNLGNVPEGGAVNEGFSDCMGNAIRQYGKQSITIDWLIGDEIGGAPFRDMANPKSTGNPDTYLGTNWDFAQEVHQNSTIMSHSFYLVSEGGSGTNDNGDAYTVTAMGLSTASAIWFRMNTVYLTPNSGYAEARYYAIQAATDLYGPCSPEVIATVDAWHAVGVGAAFVPGVNSDFNSVVTSYCLAPASVPFTNLSNNAGSYTWDFGDGTTSTLTNPIHVYANYGNYTVKLVSDGGTCGIDSVTKNAYISVDVANPCVVSLPLNGIGTTQTACAGQLFDDGGPTANYADLSIRSITIAPTGAASVELTFSVFDLENTYDFLYIYDGATTTSPLLGSYTGNTLPPVINSTGGAITIRMTSDQLVNGAGFALAWLCTLTTIAPTANFTSDVTSSCTGSIIFTDLSVDGPTSWLWDFGDGGTSSLQNPSHYYQANGTYTVALVASNGFGSNSNTKTAYITINLPSSPTAVGVTICAGTSASLTASGNDSITWFSAPAPNGTPLYTGSVFTTPALNNATTYYVESDIYSPAQNNGPLDNTFGGGTIYTNTNYHDLIFDCYTATRLASVKVYAQGAAIRTITLIDNTGTTLQSLAVNIPDGMSIVTLNFDLPVGTDLELGIAGNVNLFRNNSGAAFPYTLAGIVSIKGTNAGMAGYYYYFYDWVLQDAPCMSARTPVNVAILPSPVTLFSFAYLTNVVNFIDASIGATSWSWDFGDGSTSTLQNPQHTYATVGTYTVTLTTTAGSCSTTVSHQVTINIVGIYEQSASDLFSMFPNPANNEVVIKLSKALQKSDCGIKLTNSLGQIVFEKNFTGQLSSYTINVNRFPAGIYTVAIQSGDKKYYQKLTKQ